MGVCTSHLTVRVFMAVLVAVLVLEVKSDFLIYRLLSVNRSNILILVGV